MAIHGRYRTARGKSMWAGHSCFHSHQDDESANIRIHARDWRWCSASLITLPPESPFADLDMLYRQILSAHPDCDRLLYISRSDLYFPRIIFKRKRDADLLGSWNICSTLDQEKWR
ncbi:hypothetical protein L218DRAFT_908956 [Marasmius fiardii PR-910]|nr:hypothetical protein L218DRAFT_908956 [Marasmius fiardii PR-910]